MADRKSAGLVLNRQFGIALEPKGPFRRNCGKHGPEPTNTLLALLQLLNYWKTNTAIQPAVAISQNSPISKITFVRRPAESGVTPSKLVSWADMASYHFALLHEIVQPHW